MLFNKNDGKANDRVIYKTKPNMLLGCKKAILGIVILAIILIVSPIVIRFIGEMQVYMISQIKLSLTRYTAIAFFVIILIDVLYIIWQLIGWYSMEYTLTDTKIIIKSGVLSTKKNYMPYATIQDVNTSQSILARVFNVGTVSVYSAYDNNQMELKNISNPSEIEEVIFSRMVGPRNFQAPPQSALQYPERSYRDEEYYPRENVPFAQEDYVSPDDYVGMNDYYDEYEPITPITHERNNPPRREYDYYPEDFSNINNQSRHTYEYEPYGSGYGKAPSSPKREVNYNQISDDYYNSERDYYQNNESQNHYDEVVKESRQNDQDDMGDSSEHAVQRHFDKFKK